MAERTIKRIKEDIASNIQSYDTRRVLDIYKAEIVQGIPLDRLQEICEAYKDGRCIVLPVPAEKGDPKPDCFYQEFCGASPWCLGFASANDDEPIEHCKKCWYCECGNYAEEHDREEAEAALKENGK